MHIELFENKVLRRILGRNKGKLEKTA